MTGQPALRRSAWLAWVAAGTGHLVHHHVAVAQPVLVDTTGTPLALATGYPSRRLATGDDRTTLRNAVACACLATGWLQVASKAPGNASEPAPWRPGTANSFGVHAGNMGLSS